MTNSGGQGLEKIIKVDRNYKRKAPTSLSLSKNNIYEVKGSVVGKLQTTDPDEVDKHYY